MCKLPVIQDMLYDELRQLGFDTRSDGTNDAAPLDPGAKVIHRCRPSLKLVVAWPIWCGLFDFRRFGLFGMMGMKYLSVNKPRRFTRH